MVQYCHFWKWAKNTDGGSIFEGFYTISPQNSEVDFLYNFYYILTMIKTEINYVAITLSFDFFLLD